MNSSFEEHPSNQELFEAICNREDEGRRYFGLCDAFRRRGYRLMAVPLEGCYDGFCDKMQDGLEKLDRRAEEIRKAWRFRGWSKALIAHLQERVPEPVWGVEPDLPRKPQPEYDPGGPNV